MAIPPDYFTGNFGRAQSLDGSLNGVYTLFVTNSDRLCVINVPASFAIGSTVVRNAYLTTSTSDVYYGDSEIGKLDAPLERPKQCGFILNERGPLVVYADTLEGDGIYRTYGAQFGAGSTSVMNRRDVGTVRTYTGIAGDFISAAIGPGAGQGTVASENKIYINNDHRPVFDTGSWNDITHNPNTANSTLDETSNYTIKKRLCDDESAVEYITDEGQKYAPEGLVRTFVTPTTGLPAKVTSAGNNAVLWVCSKPLNKISLTVSTNFTDSKGILRVLGEVLIENNIVNKNLYSPISISENNPYTSSANVIFKPLEWICFYIGCTDGFVRLVCWNIIPSSSIIKDERGCLWTVYEAQKPV